ncbi:MAG: bifunctional adenosylcobinamide kinase/adenosylcobinamide-phosphate guanylyltransferase [Coriobacteriales bacterium]|jgi:adenosylcobinamide kinase/adenosylcobinamide-phosphate guanylyltransferase|nr:bifunctional adenosylcobinamide kinase/adenosylcobinamide-phosphate guanylyltransferase [Coriobacteriales bacterium]
MRVLFTGGSACGKSSYAERMASALPGPRYYLATMVGSNDEEFLRRIERHHAMRRDRGFDSIERPRSVSGIDLADDSCVLLECLCNLAANEMFDEDNRLDNGAFQRILDDIKVLEEKCAHLLVVTNDVGSGSALGYSDSTCAYVELLGSLNAALAERFDVVYELVCGIPLRVKGAPWEAEPQ